MDYSNEEAEPSDDQESHNMSIGRFYECVFCKRGFTTAQALGGHMNIHRKDRAKTKPAATTSNNHEQNYFGSTPSPSPRVFQSLSSNYDPPQPSYTTFFPVSTSTTQSQSYGNYNNHEYSLGYGDQFQSFDSCYGDDWRINLSLQYGSPIIEEIKKNGRENDLDLELRLGPDPN